MKYKLKMISYKLFVFNFCESVNCKTRDDWRDTTYTRDETLEACDVIIIELLDYRIENNNNMILIFCTRFYLICVYTKN